MFITFNGIFNTFSLLTIRVLNEYTVVVLVNLITIGTVVFRLFIEESDSCFLVILLTVTISKMIIKSHLFDNIVNV